jgi:hypothetical protein
VLTGKRFKLRRETLGIESQDGDRVAVRVPSDSIVEVISGPTEHDMRMVQVHWKGRALVMFAEDIRQRGEEILE